MSYWHQDIEMDPRDKTDNQEIDLHIYGQLTFYKVTKQFSEKKESFSTSAAGTIGYSYVKKSEC